MKEAGLGPLQDGARVVIIGGGPAGTAAAIAIKKLASGMGRQIQVTIVEEKQFAGEQFHNLCVGVLSPPIAEMIENDLGIPFPRHLNHTPITGYVLHTGRRQIILDGAPEAEPSIALRRVQFDAYMLEAARQQGAEIVTARVTDVEFHTDQVVIYTNSAPLRADLVIGAFGSDEGAETFFEQAVGYRPPAALYSIVTKYHPGEPAMQNFGQRVHAFLPPNPFIEFGGITPKADHLTINIAGAALNIHVMDDFIHLNAVRSALPNLENAGRIKPKDLRYFKGRFPCGLAGKFWGDRYVMVGDAAGLVRAFKGKGVTSAVQTGVRAAQVILKEGISANAFKAYQAANHDIISDLPFGKAMRYFTITAARMGFMDIILRAAEQDTRLQQALFDAVSGRRSYQLILQQALTFTSVRKVLAALARQLAGA
ncbi:MAG TPA: FAD/NAD(P)-binding protein [Anaerolineales bacterium]|nr:FAD/NAD(P)-binding protein [Anaerolineales bacterium]